MLERIRNKLQALECDAWELTETVKKGWEFYFIRHALDQNRVTEVKTCRVRLYRSLEGGKYLGSASGSVSPTADDAEIDRLLEDLYDQAGFVKNPAYTLNDRPVDLPEKTEPVDIEAIAERFLRAMQEIPETADEDVNSYEIFVSEIDRRTLNSNGVSYHCVYPSSMIEVVINARRDGHEIELYRNFTSGTCDAEKLKADVTAALRCGKDRLTARPTPKLGKSAVIFSTADAVNIYEYFLYHTGAAAKYRRISDWEIGKPVCDAFTGDKVTLEALSSLRNSSEDFPVDEEGAVIRDCTLIRDGVVERFWGDRQFSQYLGLDDSFIVHNYRVGGGKRTAAEIRDGDFLEVVEFSDFQVDPMSGDIAGEIRLGYLHRDGKTVVVTGGSVSGSMTEAAASMTFSEETVQYDICVIPAVTRLEDMRITGIEDLD